MESQEELKVQQLCESCEQVKCAMRQQIHDLEVVWDYVFQQVYSTLADYLPAFIAFIQAYCIDHSSGSSFAKLHPPIDDSPTIILPLVHITAALVVVTHIALLLVFFCVLLNGLQK